MRVSRRAILVLGIMPLAGCAVLGPVADPNETNAPYQACARIAEAPPAATPAAPQCVSLRLRAASGQWGAFGGTVSAGEELLAIPSGTPQCAHSNYTHVVLEGSSDSGAMRIAVPDAFGRGDRGRSFAWRTPRARWTADNIGTALHLPTAARVMVSEGQVRLSSLCFRSYTH
ncbi:hypothetical protein [Allosphingosinicella sp.]|uniref:hypothetical protein n=1 Tax=Allosphingosinicella sp. TaxID=2823234 RepID=UPI003784070D